MNSLQIYIMMQVSSLTYDWGLVIQLASIVFLTGVAYASFETKKHATGTAEELRSFNASTYMPRELSLEKWRHNDQAHEELKQMLQQILGELRKGD